MKRILLCPPDHYDIEYEINPWMHVDNKVDQTDVQKSYISLKELYLSLGVEVYEIEPAKGLPDMVYSANFGQVIGKKFVRSNFKYPQRRKEADLAAKYFQEKFGFEDVPLPNDIFFEGQGDLLNDGERFFFGWGKRSEKEAKPYLEKYFGREIIDFNLVNPYFYHLDTAFSPITSEIAVYNPESFTDEGIQTIKRHFSTVIETNEEDNKVIACNMVIVGKNIVHGTGISQSLGDQLASLGFILHAIDTTEYIKGGGSVKCVSFEF